MLNGSMKLLMRKFHLLKNNMKSILIIITCVYFLSCNCSSKNKEELFLEDISVINKIKTLYTGSLPVMRFNLSIPRDEFHEDLTCSLKTKDTFFLLNLYKVEEAKSVFKVSFETKFNLVFKSLKEMSEILDTSFLLLRSEDYVVTIDLDQNGIFRRYYLDEVLISDDDSINMNAKIELKKYLEDFNIGR